MLLIPGFPSSIYICLMNVKFYLSDIDKIAEQFWEEIGNKRIVVFHGQMGVGKTTFIHALCDVKKVSSTVGSPTFSLINEYRYPGGLIYHIDLYRIRDEEEAIRAGIEDCLYTNAICLVEWPDRAPALFPEGTVHVYFDVVDTNNRHLRIGDK